MPDLRARPSSGRAHWRRAWAVWAAVAVLGGGSAARGQLVITPTFDSSITNDPNAALLQADILTAITAYQTLFTDNVTVSILFRYATTTPGGGSMGGSLARSNYTLYSRAYGTYVTALTNDASKSANDLTALAHLPAAGAFPNAPTRITVSSANGRALSMNTPGAMDATANVGTGGTFDGIVTINSGQNFALTRPVAGTGKFDVLQSIEHEIDEVLGFGSILPATTDFSGNAAVRPQDLFRYSAPGTVSLASGGSASSYFSIDGGQTLIVSYNQNSTGDYGDWGPSPTPLVQLAFSFPNTQSDVTRDSPEGVGLDVIGYDLTPVPEPGGLALAALAAAALARRVRRKAGERPAVGLQP